MLQVNASLPLRKNTLLVTVSANGFDLLFMCLCPDTEYEKSSQLTFFPVLFSFISCVGGAVW